MEQENLYQVMFKHATIGILIVESDGNILKANAFAERLFGYETNELEGQSVDILVPDALRGGHAKNRQGYHHKPVDRTMGAGLDLYAKQKNGHTFPVEISLGHAELGGKKIAIAYINNITEKKRNEALNQDISKIVEESLNEIFIFDADSLTFIQVNEGGRKNLGYSPAELTRLTPIDIKPAYTTAAFLKVLAPLRNGQKERLIFETIHERKDGSIYPVEIHLQFASFANQPVYVAIVVDITERKESQQKILEYSQQLEEKVKERTIELEESQIKLNEAQSIAKMGHWDYFPKEHKLVFSKGMYQIYELNPSEDISYELIHELTHPDDLEMVKAEISKAAQDKKSISINHRIITPNKTLKYVRSNVQPPSFDEKGELIRIFGVLKDITTLKESELKLHEALNKEKELGLLKSRFVSMASHEFRTPLSSILSSAELLGMYLEVGRHDKCGRNIDRIKNSVRNLTGILNDFLSLEKLEAGKIDVQKTEVNLREFLEELQEEVKPILQSTQQLVFRHNIPVTIKTDPYLLKNILINLTSNAIKYSPKGEDVTLEINQTKEQLIFKVIDQGIGIPDADKQYMFSRFFRASNVENIKGTGLGLTIVKRYLDLMGGDMGFESEYGKGSTFYFNLPA